MLRKKMRKVAAKSDEEKMKVEESERLAAESSKHVHTKEEEMHVGERSDPREVLKTIPWPKSVDQWASLQSKIWAGHPPLRRGWIRCWAKGVDAEYYLRQSDLYTTFNSDDVIER